MTEQGPARPWQVTVAVLLLAGWWLSIVAVVTLVLLSLDEGGNQLAEALSSLGCTSVPVALVLVSVWRGGAGTIVAIFFGFLLGITTEIAGTVMLIQWFLGGSPRIDWWASLFLVAYGLFTLQAARLLISPPAKAYARYRQPS